MPSRPSRLVDEHDSHLLTQRPGLSNDASEIRRAQSTTYLAIERFDRTVADGAVRPLHQEDLAQALRLDWRETDTKFQDPDWPDDPGGPRCDASPSCSARSRAATRRWSSGHAP